MWTQVGNLRVLGSALFAHRRSGENAPARDVTSRVWELVFIWVVFPHFLLVPSPGLSVASTTPTVKSFGLCFSQLVHISFTTDGSRLFRRIHDTSNKKRAHRISPVCCGRWYRCCVYLKQRIGAVLYARFIVPPPDLGSRVWS